LRQKVEEEVFPSRKSFYSLWLWWMMQYLKVITHTLLTSSSGSPSKSSGNIIYHYNLYIYTSKPTSYC